MTLPPDPRWCARIAAHRDPPEAGLPAETPGAADAPDGLDESCDVCGSARTEWRKCKLVCLDCRQIVKSCADL
ncbi:MAG TPA: hypothetical protein VHG51_08020 [Longimicrobiaceae bacterium]|nr:hypothetical protein [Longimicrobiaceae bacterium]